MTADKDESLAASNASTWTEVELENELRKNASALVNDCCQTFEAEAIKQKLHDQVSLLGKSGDALSMDQLNSRRESFQLAIAKILRSIDAQIAKGR